MKLAFKLKLFIPLLFAAAPLVAACGDGGDDPQPFQGSDTSDTTLDPADGSPNADTNAPDDTKGNGQSDSNGGGKTEPDPSTVVIPNPADFKFASTHVFSIDDILGGVDGVTAATNPAIVCTTGCDDRVQVDGSVTLFPLDTSFGWDVVDYVGGKRRPMDGVHAEGHAGNIIADGEIIGLAVSNAPTLQYKTGRNRGQWCAGLGGTLVKCKSNQYVAMEHVLTCAETVPYFYFHPDTGMPTLPDYSSCRPLNDVLDKDPATLTEYLFDLDESNMAIGEDYSIILGENIDEWKYIWGNTDKRPTDVRINVHIPVPTEWDSAEYKVTRAILAIVHTTTNNPNEKVLPEGFDNEAPEGRTPQYTVNPAGQWLSAIDCYEGDGDFIPAGTVLRNPAFAQPDAVTEDLQDGFTNAWYTTLDRDPFQPGLETGPRWRLKAPKYGQALPGVDIPLLNCDPGPLQKGEAAYERGEMTATILNLLDPQENADGPVFVTSSAFAETNDHQFLQEDDLTVDGLKLTKDFDLQIHVKGDRKPVRIYRAVLYLDYEPLGE